MPKLRFVAAAVLICSWACAGGDAPEPSDGNGAQPLARREPPSATSSATAQLADAADAEVLGGSENPTTEGSNTNWMPTEPWLGLDPADAHRPQARQRPDPRKPAGGQQGDQDPAPDQGQPSTMPAQPGPSSSSGSSSGSNHSTPSPD